jgi:lysophospholipase L1-like esterase
MGRSYLVAVALAVLAAGCGSPSRPSPIDAPRILCPASVTAHVAAAPAIVTYQPPTVVGGVTPVTTQCSPTSGSLLPAGSTPVMCTALDAQTRTDSCSFSITVTVVAGPRIGATRYVAFGDSITEGKQGPAGYHSDPRFPFPDAYPKVLYDLLAERYTAQTIEMYAEGIGGNQVRGGTPPDGVTRLPGVLNADMPQVLLLQQGVNDLINGGSITNVVDGLRDMLREAQRRGILVFLATLLPQRPGGSRTGHIELIAPANDRIRALSASEGAILVDVYQAFGGSPDPWIDADGLHPTVDGYKRMADTFFAQIKGRLEVEQAKPFSLAPRLTP